MNSLWQSQSQHLDTISGLSLELREALLSVQQLVLQLESEIMSIRTLMSDSLQCYNRNEEEQELVI